MDNKSIVLVTAATHRRRIGLKKIEKIEAEPKKSLRWQIYFTFH
jgi:hypothetical protein